MEYAAVITMFSVLLATGCCDQLCPAGTYLTNTRTLYATEPCCSPCPDGTFQNQANSATRCADCSVACQQKEIKAKECTKDSDMVCHCENGTHRASEHGGCVSHKPCNAGKGVNVAGNHEHDTICEKCLSGTFANEESYTQPCKPCRTCPFGQEVAQNCTSSNDTKCRPKDCGPLAKPANGNVNISTGSQHNDVATYSCDIGHKAIGNLSRTCTDGSWTGCQPVCMTKDCGPLANPLRGNVDISMGTLHNAVATYSCDFGHNAIGNLSRTCTDGSWTGYQPDCIPKDCEPLSDPAHGNVHISTGTRHNNVAIYSCHASHNAVGNIYRTCRNGSWTSCQPECIPKDAPVAIITVSILAAVEALVIVFHLYRIYKKKWKDMNCCPRKGNGDKRKKTPEEQVSFLPGQQADPGANRDGDVSANANTENPTRPIAESSSDSASGELPPPAGLNSNHFFQMHSGRSQ